MSAIYAIARTDSRCFGHGDYANITSIEPRGCYGEGGFHPCFTTKADAEEYLRGVEWSSDLSVVTLQLIPPKENP